jgi:type VII secretion integral membrane protein EccD
MDVALPDNMLVGELLPYLLRHAGDGLGDDGERHGGWVLRRATGTVLEPNRNLAVQGVRDGEILHLAPRRVNWPELAYDDVVEVIASGARQGSRTWGNAATRRSGLAVSCALLALGLVVVVLSGPPWPLPAGLATGIATVLAVAGVVAARAFGDAVAGVVAAASGLPYALLGGAFLALPNDAALTDVSAPNLLLGSAVLLFYSVLGYVGVAAVQRLFMAGFAVGAAGVLAAGLCLAGMSPTAAAAITLTVVIGMLPAYPLVASWIGRLPVPQLPDRPEGILEDRPVPRRADVFAAVFRANELLTGMLLAAAVTGVAAMAFLLVIADRVAAGTLLSVTGALALLLRGRLFPAVWQRIPLLVGGAAGLALLVVGVALDARGGVALLYLVALVVVAALVYAAGLRFSRGKPSPYVGRLADIADVLAILALTPLACAVAGLYGAVQGLFASMGG